MSITITDEMIDKAARALAPWAFTGGTTGPGAILFCRAQAKMTLEAALAGVAYDLAITQLTHERDAARAQYAELEETHNRDTDRLVRRIHELERDLRRTGDAHMGIKVALAGNQLKADKRRLQFEVQRLTTELRLFCLFTLRCIDTGPGHLTDLTQEARHIITWIAKHPGSDRRNDLPTADETTNNETTPEEQPDDVAPEAED